MDAWQTRRERLGSGEADWGMAMRIVRCGCAVLIGLALVGCGGTKNGERAAPAEPATTTTSDPGEGQTVGQSEYPLVVADPESYKGAAVEIVGKVFSDVERDSAGTYFQMYADPKSSGANTIVGIADPAFQVADGDYVRVSGTIQGKYTGQNAFGGDVSAVEIRADSVAKTTALASASPAVATLGRATYTQFAITLTVPKVEFAADETRIFVTTINRSTSPISLFGSSVKAVSGGVQVESTYTPDEYPQLASDIDPGARSSGVIVFPKMNPHAALRLTFEGYSDNSDIGDYGSLKWIFTWAAS